MVLAILAIFLLVITQLVDFVKLPQMGGFAMPGTGTGVFEEVTVERGDTENQIVVIDVTGVISAYDSSGTGMNMVNGIKRRLKIAAKDPTTRAVVLRVDSPGGEVLASDDIAKAIERFQAKENIPVIASMGSLAASGGYYVSAPCRWIVAHPLTITGSIGVIMQGFNYRGVMDKIGVTPMVYKSGKYKDMLSGMRTPDEIPADEQKMVQALIDQTYDRFKEVVKDGRENAFNKNKGLGFAEDARELGENWQEMVDGRVFSGKTAFDNGFVDELGGLDVAIDRAKELAGVSSARVVKYQVPFDIGNIFRLLGKSPVGGQAKITVDLGINTPNVEPGRLYFLSSTYVR